MHDELTAQVLPVAPDPASARVVLSAPESGREAWAGAPSAVVAGGEIYLAYRMRAPERRGYAVRIARSADGVRFTTLLTISKEQMDCESLERPALVLADDGTWRLYLSCATWGTKHWRVELIEAATPAAFDPALRRVVLPGDAATAVKDPVIVRGDGRWHLWAAVHPLDDPDHTDRMRTDYATSPDGLCWTWHGTALHPRAGAWDARGARVAAVSFTPGGVTAYYDGRATAAQNCEERTGLAAGPGPGELMALDGGPVAQSRHHGHGLRYLSAVDLPDGSQRFYYELTNASGSHDLVTELRPG